MILKNRSNTLYKINKVVCFYNSHVYIFLISLVMVTRNEVQITENCKLWKLKTEQRKAKTEKQEPKLK